MNMLKTKKTKIKNKKYKERNKNTNKVMILSMTMKILTSNQASKWIKNKRYHQDKKFFMTQKLFCNPILKTLMA